MSAFLFGGFWAIFHKLYRIGFGTIILLILFYIVIDGFEIKEKMSELVELLFWTPIHFLFGFKGTLWFEQKLNQQGYHLHDTVESDSFQGAISILKFKLDRLDEE